MIAPFRQTRATFVALGVMLGALGVACTGDEQSLGGPPKDSPITVPTTWLRDHRSCPPIKPAEGSACATVDEHDAAVAPQCTYGNPDDPGCPSICVCGFNGGWSCFHTACGILSADDCFENEPCRDGVGCASETNVCTCTGADQRLRCEPRDAATIP